MKGTIVLVALVVGISTLVSCSNDTASPTEEPQRLVHLSGKVTISDVPGLINGEAASGAFAHLFGKRLSFDIQFEQITEVRREGLESGEARVMYESSPVSLRIEGDDAVSAQVVAQLSGQKMWLDLNDATVFLDFTGGLRGVGSNELYTMEITVLMPASLGRDGYPLLSDFEHVAGEATLRRLENAGTRMTDLARGAATISFVGSQ